MKANVSQSVLLQKQLELVGNIVGAKEFAHLVHAYIVKILLTVGPLEQRLILLLLCPLLLQEFPHGGDQRQGTKAGSGFQLVLGEDPVLAVFFSVGDLVVDGNGPPVKVYGAPSDSQHLTAPQSVVGRKLDDHRHGIIPRGLEQGSQFLFGIKSRQIFALLGPVHFVCHIFCD